MNLMLFTEEGGFTLPEDPAGRIVWLLILAAFVGAYFVISRSRRRTQEHYLDSKRRAAELRANDPDMRKDDD